MEALRLAKESRWRKGRSRAPSLRRPTTIILSRGETAALRVRRGEFRVACVTGLVWATKSGWADDSVLLPSQSVLYRGRGTVVIEALRTSALRIEREEVLVIASGSSLRPAMILG
jgi:hypothetical protein